MIYLFLIYLIYLAVAIISSTGTALDARGLMCPWQAQSNFWRGPCYQLDRVFYAILKNSAGKCFEL
mgnify:CR=1 FL=1